MDEVLLLAAVFESSLDAKLIIYSNGKIYRANRAAEKIFLRPGKKDLKGRNLFSLISKKTRVNLENFLNSAKHSRQLHEELELKINNQTKVFDVTANAFFVGNLHLLILRDITDRVREKEAREQFTAIAGHELKTPLAVIIAYTDLLKRRYQDERGTLVFLDKIANKSKVLAEYIESILDETRIGTGKFTFDNKLHRLDAIVINTVRELRKAYPSAKLIGTGETQKLVTVDKERIAQVLRNLIVNAIKHSPRNKAIYIDIGDTPAGVYFSVKDQGRGIPLKEQNAIFKAFYRSSKAAKHGSGLGLGLYIAKQILNQYQGTVTVESRMGKGAKFIVELPASNESHT